MLSLSDKRRGKRTKLTGRTTVCRLPIRKYRTQKRGRLREARETKRDGQFGHGVVWVVNVLARTTRQHVSMPMECQLLGGKEKTTTTKIWHVKKEYEGNGIAPFPFICVLVFAFNAFFSSSEYPLVMGLRLVRYISHPHVLVFVNMYMNNTAYNIYAFRIYVYSIYTTPSASSSSLFALAFFFSFITEYSE